VDRLECLRLPMSDKWREGVYSEEECRVESVREARAWNYPVPRDEVILSEVSSKNYTTARTNPLL
jgi:hypothetical protein